MNVLMNHIQTSDDDADLVNKAIASSNLKLTQPREAKVEDKAEDNVGSNISDLSEAEIDVEVCEERLKQLKKRKREFVETRRQRVGSRMVLKRSFSL